MAGRQIPRMRVRSRLRQQWFQVGTTLLAAVIGSNVSGQTPDFPDFPNDIPPVSSNLPPHLSEMIESQSDSDDLEILALPEPDESKLKELPEPEESQSKALPEPDESQFKALLENAGKADSEAAPSQPVPSAEPIHVEELIFDEEGPKPEVPHSQRFYTLQPDSANCDSASCDSYVILPRRRPLLGCLPCPQDPGTLFDWPCQTRTAGVPRLWEPIVSDRPTFTESSSTVGLGVAQVEMGTTYARDDEPGTKTRAYSIGEPLLRYGIYRDWLELRVGAGYQDIEVNGVERSGIDDLLVGFKIGLTPQDGLRPEMALIAQSYVPTGASAVSQDEWLPELKTIYGWEINEKLATRGSTQISRAIDDTTGDDETQWSQSWMASYRIHPRTKVFGEWFALIPTSDEETEHYASTGLTYLLTNDVQVDLRGGWGLNDEALDSFVGTGLSWRFR